MKKYIYAAASLLAGIAFLSSCAKEEAVRPQADNGERYEVGVNLNLASTRADIPATDTEKALDATKTTILVYDANGSLVNAADPGLSASFSLTSGSYTFVALGNWTANPGAISTLDAFKKTVENLDDEVAGGKFVMAGLTVQAISGNADLTITVRRLAAKFVVAGVSRNMTGTLAGQEFKVKSIYVINAVGDTQYGVLQDFGGSYTPTVWRNERRYVSSSSDSYLYKDIEDVTIANAGSSDFSANCLYSYANPTTKDGHNTAFGTAEKTRVILEAELDGTTYYYPATLPSVEANKCYTITFNVKGKGLPVDPDPENPDPDKEVGPDAPWPDNYSSDVTIEVGDWYDGGTIPGPAN